MPQDDRSEKMTVRLSADEVQLRDKLAAHLGIDGSGVMRMGMRRLAQLEGIDATEKEKPRHPKG